MRHEPSWGTLGAMSHRNRGQNAEANTPPLGSETYMRVTWRAVSTSLTLLLVSLIATLAVVVSIHDVDLLSTIALALAILAFAAQLMVSLFQSNAQAQQLSATERVNNETRALLSDISARSEALLANQSGMFNKVLEYAMRIREAVADAATEAGLEDETSGEEGPEAYERFRDLVEDNLEEIRRELLADQRTQIASLRGSQRELRPEMVKFQERNRAWAARVSSFPDEDEGRKAFRLLARLSPQQRNVLIRRGTEDMMRAKRGSVPGNMVPWPNPDLQPLVDLGLMRVHERGNRDGRTMIRWTEDGVGVLRLVLPGGEVPVWLQELRRGSDPAEA